MQAANLKRQLIAQVLDSLKTDGSPAVPVPFVERLLDDLTREDCAKASVDGLRATVLTFWQLCQQREPGRLNLRARQSMPDENAWGATRTAIEMVTDDSPFLVDSLVSELERWELEIHCVLHPQLTVRRDAAGVIQKILPLGEDHPDAVDESAMYFEVDPLPSAAERLALESALRRVLRDVRLAVEDWPAMRQAAATVLNELETTTLEMPGDELTEACEFLRWIDNDHFTFLGFLEYQLESRDGKRYLKPVPDSGLGLSRRIPLGEKARGEQPLLPPAVRFIEGEQLVAVTKSISKSTVHRNVHMDIISVKRFDDQGTLLGEYRFLGLFTSMAYSITASNIPMMRRKVARVVARTQFLEASHNAKSLRHIVEHYPRDELFQTSEDDLYHFALRILELRLKPKLALLVRHDDEGRFASCMLYVPREQHNTRMRLRTQEVLEEAFEGKVTSFATLISDGPLAQVHFLVETPHDREPKLSVPEIEARLAVVGRSWSDRLKGPLGASEGQQEGLERWRRYRQAFPVAYQDHFSPDVAAQDIPYIEEVLSTSGLCLRLYRRQSAATSRLHLRTFELAVPSPLSTFLPKIENMGLVVNTEIPYEVWPAGATNPVWVRELELLVHDIHVDPDAVQDNFSDAFRHIWNGEMENDPFNRLILRAGLEWRQVVVFRAYCKYLRQTGIVFSQRYMAECLARNPQLVTSMFELFDAYLNPAQQEREDLVDHQNRLLRRLTRGLEKVKSLDEDRILGRFLNLVRSTLRTNFFQLDDEGKVKSYVSFKFDGHQVRDLPEPRPLFEIFVYSTRMEAVHLRSGKVARGGIRWSDRREDFRTEILGLVKSQIVKNAVIVPVGAKGGFVVKKPPAAGDREALLAEGIACYKTMIRGMLDITDNQQGEIILPPADTVRRDGDDPYLVVAADKGTATFSDIANQVARDYGFWLDDAFASGGSVGYDHKKMGITARGAWESVKRHFREMGRNTQSEPFTVVGVGDMSGDVFGNGMLLSKHIELVGAFNHLHIFVDPKPDAATSFAERRRLFEMPRSAWSDYDNSLLSEGGGVYDRQAKELEISPQVKERFALPSSTVTPAELIRGMLNAPVDLLWFGGIGTYIKAGHETHSSVGDWNNDDIRVDASELTCSVIGEGANLGVTQAGRIEFALRGGRINTDFIDNSGGVDCSDHEVNIKIAFSDAIARQQLTLEERDILLAKMTDEVAQLVLQDNYMQTHAITLSSFQKTALIDDQARLMRQLERAHLLDRKLEGLPDDATLMERRDRMQGLTRPELAVLLAYSKIMVYNELLDSPLPDDELLIEDLTRYFPEPMQSRFRESLVSHRLRREIIATHVTNSIINRVGPTFISRLSEETGATVSAISRAYAAVRELFDLRSLWEEIEALDGNTPAELQIRLYLESVEMIERATRWFLRHGGRPLDISASVSRYEQGIVTVTAQIEHLLASKAKQRVRGRRKRLVDRGLPRPLASRMANLALMPSACDVARCALEADEPVEDVGRVFFLLGEHLGIDRLRRAAAEVGKLGSWQQAAVNVTISDFFTHQAQLARQVVSHAGEGKDRARQAFNAWRRRHSVEVERIESMIHEFESAPRIELAMLTIAERQLRQLVEHD